MSRLRDGYLPTRILDRLETDVVPRTAEYLAIALDAPLLSVRRALLRLQARGAVRVVGFSLDRFPQSRWSLTQDSG